MDASIEKPLAPPAESLLPIRTVSVLTGVNAVTLRAWERRYGLITPATHAKGASAVHTTGCGPDQSSRRAA